MKNDIDLVHQLREDCINFIPINIELNGMLIDSLKLKKHVFVKVLIKQKEIRSASSSFN